MAPNVAKLSFCGCVATIPPVSLEFKIDATSGPARTGRLITPHGEVETPVFMPVGTLASVKGISQDCWKNSAYRSCWATPITSICGRASNQVRKLGGLHGFMSWPRAILTDSGGFQVFSLNELRKVNEDGVTFRSHLDGSSHFFSPRAPWKRRSASAPTSSWHSMSARSIPQKQPNA